MGFNFKYICTNPWNEKNLYTRSNLYFKNVIAISVRNDRNFYNQLTFFFYSHLNSYPSYIRPSASVKFYVLIELVGMERDSKQQHILSICERNPYFRKWDLSFNTFLFSSWRACHLHVCWDTDYRCVHQSILVDVSQNKVFLFTNKGELLLSFMKFRNEEILVFLCPFCSKLNVIIIIIKCKAFVNMSLRRYLYIFSFCVIFNLKKFLTRVFKVFLFTLTYIYVYIYITC